VSSTPAGRRYRWTILAAGVFAQASFSALLLGLPSIAPQVQDRYALTLTQLGVVLAAVNFGGVVTLLPWGLLADRIGERLVIGIGLCASALALVVAAFTSTFAGLVIALAAAGALGSGVNSASGRAVMGWFGPEERGLALGIRQTSVPLGGAIAAGALPALANSLSVRAALIGLAAGCFAAGIAGAVLIRAEPSGDLGELSRPLHDSRIWRLCTASSFYVMTQIALISFVVVFLHKHRGVSTAAAAAVLALIEVLGGATRIILGRWSDHLRARIRPLRAVALGLALSVAVATAAVEAPLPLTIATLVIAGTLALSWNGLSFTAAAELAGQRSSGAAIGLQQTFLAAGSIVAPIVFALLVHASWRVAFAVAAASPIVGYALLRPLSEPRP
jgi:sugar phosphate permease